MSAENKAIVRRFYQEVINQGNLRLAEELLAPDFFEQPNPAGEVTGIEGFKQFFSTLASTFPDLEVTIEDLIAEGDKVAARITVRGTHKGTFMGRIPATGRQAVWTGIDILQISDGKIAGRWVQRDLLGLMQQLGGT